MNENSGHGHTPCCCSLCARCEERPFPPDRADSLFPLQTCSKRLRCVGMQEAPSVLTWKKGSWDGFARWVKGGEGL